MLRRPVCSVWATSAKFKVGSFSRRSARRWHMLSKALRDFADSGSTCAWRVGAALDCSGASSKMAKPLVPPTPSEFTPARLGVALRGHDCSSAFTKNGLRSNSISGLAFLKCKLGGSCSWRSDSTTFRKLATPAAVSVWPMFDLHEPMPQKPDF